MKIRLKAKDIQMHTHTYMKKNPMEFWFYKPNATAEKSTAADYFLVECPML